MDKNKIEELLKVNLFKELGLENLSPEARKDMIDEISQVVIQGLWVRVLERLTPAEQEELEAKTNTVSDPTELVDFIKTKIPNLEEMLKEEVASYKETLLAK